MTHDDPDTVRIPIFKDGNPGWIVGYYSDFERDYVDIDLVDGRQTFVLLPDYGKRITPRVEGAST